MNITPVGILGATGYAGRELTRLVLGHPSLELSFAASHERAAHPLRVAGQVLDICPAADAPLADAALVFSALPHGASAPWVAHAREAGARVVDLSADLRPGNDGALEAPYGLPELDRAALPGATIVANPGCYPTAVLLALLPLLERDLIAPGATICATAASGATGAGSAPRQELLFAEVANDYRAYAVGNDHRHGRELRAVLHRFRTEADLVFTPHLLPVPRGILATITVPTRERVSNPFEFWRSRYRAEPFVEVTPLPPSLRDVVHRNVAAICATEAVHTRRPTLVVVAAIDNLMKGAAGQALQNANLLLGLEETMGLPR